MKSKIHTVKRVNYEQVDTIVSSDIVFVGDITAGNSIRYEGNLKGTISISGNLIVGRNALITGSIKATNIHIIGTVEGDVVCDQLKILSTGKLTGDAEVKSLIIDEGAIFIGRNRIVEEAETDPTINDILDSVE
jgi:cytoskeletal protein CcmA (bactofilin family)